MLTSRLRKAALLVLLAPALALGWAVAPALSTTPYQPGGVDFTQALPPVERLPAAAGAAAGRARGEHAGHEHGARVRFRTSPIDAPHRFDAVGVAGEMRPLEFRVRERGEPWSDWVETANGDPVLAGGAEQVQVRSRGIRPRGELHYVNVSGDATPASGLLNDLRSAANAAFVSVFAADAADAASPQPKFVTRRQWGAKAKQGGCEPRRKASRGKVKAAAVHHTVSANAYSRAEAPNMVLAICRFHRNSNGWDDIGYNALVDRFGRVYQGRAGGMKRAPIGAHTEGHNAQATGVALLGRHDTNKASKKARTGLVRYLAWKLEVHGIKRATGSIRLLSSGGSTTRTAKGKRIRVKRIFGHQDTNSTACPGSFVQRELGKIRRRTKNRMERFADAPPGTGNNNGGSGGIGG
jgi:hypothetical protein